MKYLSLTPILAIILISACTQSNGGAGSASITLISPLGGETFNQGQKITIQYDSNGVENYQIYFTTNPDFNCSSSNGWTMIKNYPYTEKSFEYTLPYQSTTTARVRVEGLSANGDKLNFICSETFTIKA
jgi:hypothetical protein